VSGPKSFKISKHVVFEAYRRVKANKGAAGVDGESIDQFELDLKGNLYKLWNRLSSGCYFPPPVRMVEIDKPGGRGVRILGVPTVADRIAQTVWSRTWRKSSTRTRTGTGRAVARWTRSGDAGSVAGEPTG
jgi:RNA-directed DNA polymerase